MKSIKKQLIGIVVMIVTGVILFSAQTIAYFTDGSDANPVVTLVGAHLSGELIEATVPTEGASSVLGPVSLRIVPGATVQKTVAVKNTGDIKMYLRLKVDCEFDLSEENEGKPTLVEFNLNEDYWEERDGFYYYKNAVSEEETTEPLFTELSFSSQMDNTYTNSSVTLRIKAYATQAPGNGTSAFDAQGWPEVQ